jgi:AraC-like DNA-binding protein
VKLSQDPQQAAQQLRDYLATADLSRCQGKVVGAKFGIHENTLSRHLRAAGTTWQALKDAERGRRLDRLMAQGRASKPNCMAALGFAHDNSLRRFWIKHTGHSIDRYYRQRRAA